MIRTAAVTEKRSGKKPPAGTSCETLIGMCRLMGSHFHDWFDYNGVPFSILECGRTFPGFWDKKARKQRKLRINPG